MAMTCERKGNVFASTTTSQYNNASTTSEGETLLGGLITRYSHASHGFLRSTTTELSRLEKLEGQPFPLTPGKRFGLTATYASSGTYAGSGSFTVKMTCAVTDLRMKSVAGMQIPDDAPQVICLNRNKVANEITRYYFHEGSGCLVNVGQS